eukprot:3020253-Pyramimonas_sp.AAC.1
MSSQYVGLRDPFLAAVELQGEHAAEGLNDMQLEYLGCEHRLGAPYAATKRVKGVPTLVRCRHADCATRAFDEAPYGATKRER